MIADINQRVREKTMKRLEILKNFHLFEEEMTQDGKKRTQNLDDMLEIWEVARKRKLNSEAKDNNSVPSFVNSKSFIISIISF